MIGCALLGVLAGCGPRHDDGGGGSGPGGAATAGSGADAGAGAGAAGNGGSGAVGGGAGASTGGGEAGVGGGSLGYDSVIGCPAARYADEAKLTLLPMEPEFSAAKVSGDGRVVGGQFDNFGPTARWRPEGGVEPVEGLSYRLSDLSCDGSVLLTSEAGSGVWRHREGEAPQPIIQGDSYQYEPVSMTPDGNVVVGHLIGFTDLGPHPMRWTAETGPELIAPLDNTLVQRIAPDGVSMLGLDLIRIFRFTLGGTKEFVQGWVPSNGQATTPLFVSANAQTYVFNATPDYRSFFVDSVRQEVDCPSTRCEPIAISGTGKVVVVRGPTGPEIGAPWATFVWTARHGIRTLNALMAEQGAPAPGILFANDMSDDGQVFTGWMENPVGAPNQKFYAVLPRAAYD